MEQALGNLSDGGGGIGNVMENLLIDPLYLFDHSIFDHANLRIDRIDTTAAPPALHCTHL